jgi:hypothetical protein
MHAIENEKLQVLFWLIAREWTWRHKTSSWYSPDEGGGRGCHRVCSPTARSGSPARQTDASQAAYERTKATFDEFALEGDIEIDPDLINFSDIPGQTAITKAANLDIVRLLVAAGANLGDISDEMRAEMMGLESEGEVVYSPEEYIQGKSRRFGLTNPEVIEDPFLKAMVRSCATAYAARETFDDTDDFEGGPAWCFHCFGKSITELPDGRIIEIAENTRIPTTRTFVFTMTSSFITAVVVSTFCLSRSSFSTD